MIFNQKITKKFRRPNTSDPLPPKCPFLSGFVKPSTGGEVGRTSVIRYECADKIRSIFLFRLLFCLSSSGIVQNFGGTLVPGRFLGTFGSYKNSWLRNVGAPFQNLKTKKLILVFQINQSILRETEVELRSKLPNVLLKH